MNAVEREPVPTRVLNPNASEASYKPKQRSYRKTNIKKKFWRRMVPAPKCPAPKCPAPKRRRRIGDAESAAPKRTRPQNIIYKIITRKKKITNIRYGSGSIHHFFDLWMSIIICFIIRMSMFTFDTI